MRFPIRLTPSQSSAQVYLPFDADSVMVINPTGSAVLIRIGSAEIPNQQNYDRAIPAGQLVTLPITGTTFGVCFAIPAQATAIGILGGQGNEATVVFLRDEKSADMGSIAFQSLALTDPLGGLQDYSVSTGTEQIFGPFALGLWGGLQLYVNALPGSGDAYAAYEVAQTVTGPWELITANLVNENSQLYIALPRIGAYGRIRIYHEDGSAVTGKVGVRLLLEEVLTASWDNPPRQSQAFQRQFTTYNVTSNTLNTQWYDLLPWGGLEATIRPTNDTSQGRLSVLFISDPDTGTEYIMAQYPIWPRTPFTLHIPKLARYARIRVEAAPSISIVDNITGALSTRFLTSEIMELERFPFGQASQINFADPISAGNSSTREAYTLGLPAVAISIILTGLSAAGNDVSIEVSTSTDALRWTLVKYFNGKRNSSQSDWLCTINTPEDYIRVKVENITGGNFTGYMIIRPLKYPNPEQHIWSVTPFTASDSSIAANTWEKLGPNSFPTDSAAIRKLIITTDVGGILEVNFGDEVDRDNSYPILHAKMANGTPVILDFEPDRLDIPASRRRLWARPSVVMGVFASAYYV